MAMDNLRDVKGRGQVFTPADIVERMLALRRNRGRVLEPACGNGAFLHRLPDAVGIEIDAAHCPGGVLNIDFFAYSLREKFDTIIGNPPYVRHQDISDDTKRLLPRLGFDARSNLYLYFIDKCVRHLRPGGELIFITPRDFLKATSSARLNRYLYDQGTITDIIELGDARVFQDAVPNCVIWRFQKGDFGRRTTDGREFVFCGGQLLFTRGHYPVALSDVFFVKVGAVSGADDIYAHDDLGNLDFVCSVTARTGQTRRMICNKQLPYLEPFKGRLLQRRVARFDESNWWQWGRAHYVSERLRIYVNGKTRNPRPFFRHPSLHYDGAILALFPHDPRANVELLCTLLNDVDWQELGFVCDGRFIFSQRSLETAVLPEAFAPFVRQHGEAQAALV